MESVRPTNHVPTAIPSPEDVRIRLSRTLREADVLKRLLKVSEYASKELYDDPSTGVEVQLCK